MDKQLNIAFVWHMHQPLYKDPSSGEYLMPWTLYHGTKDYYDMAALLDDFPHVHQTFNLVPSLIEQLNDYASGRAVDKYRSLSAKRASQLTFDDKVFILQNFFQANWDNMILPVPRYRDLLLKRSHSSAPEDVKGVVRYFVEQDFLDLQVLFNLIWIDPLIRSRDSSLDALFKKGAGYTEEDKGIVLDKQIEIIRMILPKYRQMQEAGIIEVSTTPYYHPIMPLLCDSYSARKAMPGVTLPRERFSHPEDALAQLRKGIALYKETFGRPPQGIWPSEGSVSMEVMPLITGEGIRWIATDEDILALSLRRPVKRDAFGNCYDAFLYKPYTIHAGQGSVVAIFRDHVLSDRIGFDYARIDAEAAAGDLLTRLYNIHASVPDPENHLVSIILDGENAWESFKNDGHDFFSALYSRLNANDRLKCVTVNEFLAQGPVVEPLEWIYPGSWINHNFKIWIGHQEDNTAWDYIAEARAALVRHQDSLDPRATELSSSQAVKDAWDQIYIAEGSDWFWWYGDDHSTMCDEHFDHLFRLHVKKVYQLIGMEPPDYLDIPIIMSAVGVRPTAIPTAYINPVIDGEITDYFEWLSAGRIASHGASGAMHRAMEMRGFIGGISFGFSVDALFLRFDYTGDISIADKDWNFSITFMKPKPLKVSGVVKGTAASTVLYEKDAEAGKWIEAGPAGEVSANSVVEMKLAHALTGATPGVQMQLFIHIDSAVKGAERRPQKGFLLIDVPQENFETENWCV